MVDRRYQPDRRVPQTSNRSTPQAEITAVNSIGTSFSKISRRASTRKSPAATAGLFCFQGRQLAGRCRGELRHEAFDRLVSLLGEIGIKPRDLLRLGHE